MLASRRCVSTGVHVSTPFLVMQAGVAATHATELEALRRAHDGDMLMALQQLQVCGKESWEWRGRSLSALTPHSRALCRAS